MRGRTPAACSGGAGAGRRSSVFGRRRGLQPERTASAVRSSPERVSSWAEGLPARIAGVAARTVAAEPRTAGLRAGTAAWERDMGLVRARTASAGAGTLVACMLVCTLVQRACMTAPAGTPAAAGCCTRGRTVPSTTGWGIRAVGGMGQVRAGTWAAHKRELEQGMALVLGARGMVRERVRGMGPVCRLRVCMERAGMGRAGMGRAGMEQAGTAAPVARSRTGKRQRGSRSSCQARSSLCWRGSRWHQPCTPQSGTDRKRRHMSNCPSGFRNCPASLLASACCRTRRRPRIQTRMAEEDAATSVSQKGKQTNAANLISRGAIWRRLSGLVGLVRSDDDCEYC